MSETEANRIGTFLSPFLPCFLLYHFFLPSILLPVFLLLCSSFLLSSAVFFRTAPPGNLPPISASRYWLAAPVHSPALVSSFAACPPSSFARVLPRRAGRRGKRGKRGGRSGRRRVLLLGLRVRRVLRRWYRRSRGIKGRGRKGRGQGRGRGRSGVGKRGGTGRTLRRRVQFRGLRHLPPPPPPPRLPPPQEKKGVQSVLRSMCLQYPSLNLQLKPPIIIGRRGTTTH
ncbi:hypothetical protein DFP72DRAFT_480426 [Ephemerocybe angulata]|uniref:Transmembrane protein n=1 Tax=Ephemerocybe angulata TaxID=980116 RepID=A0A8H6IDU5_9AGAR|nr:hypothetical protein DFP72DRAFT_480426 [Tulosesus angulatus]